MFQPPPTPASSPDASPGPMTSAGEPRPGGWQGPRDTVCLDRDQARQAGQCRDRQSTAGTPSPVSANTSLVQVRSCVSGRHGTSPGAAAFPFTGPMLPKRFAGQERKELDLETLPSKIPHFVLPLSPKHTSKNPNFSFSLPTSLPCLSLPPLPPP